MARKRIQQQNDQMRERILETARRILATEGADAVSVRRIGADMGYSPGILYHYFGSKEEILRTLLLEGYRRILDAIPKPTERTSPPDAVRQAIQGYLDGVLQWPEEYRAVMLSSDVEILSVTSVLDEDVCEKREAFRWLANAIQEGMEQGFFAAGDATLTAQAVWCAMYGLAIRLIVEGAARGERRDALMQRQAAIIVRGLSG